MNKSNEYSQQLSKIFTIDKLKAFHNERFVRLAYRLVLKREADLEGLNYCLENIRVNISPLEILEKLKTSDEHQQMSIFIISKVDKFFFVPAPILSSNFSCQRESPPLSESINIQKLMKKIDEEAVRREEK